MTCPYCKGWAADHEDLPREDGEKGLVRCPECDSVFVVSWHIVHSAETLDDAFRYGLPSDFHEQLRDV